MNMRKLTCIFLLLIQIMVAENIEAQWTAEKCPTGLNLNSVSFSGRDNGSIVGEKGIILFRINGNWVVQNSPTKENLYSVTLLDKNNGWAVGAKGTIIHYNGSDWKLVDCPTRYDLYSVSFKDPENGVAVGRNGALLFYMNGIWKMAELKTRADLFASTYMGDDLVIGGGLEYLNVPVMKMKYNNPSVITDIYNSNIVVTGMAFSSPEDGWIIGSPCTLLHYDGLGWEKPFFDEKLPTLKSVSLSDEKTGICAGFNGTIITLSETGWTKENSSTSENLNSTVIVKNHYYAVGNGGTILTRLIDQNGEHSRLNNESSAEIVIYPNPCSGYFNVAMNGLNDNFAITLSITDLDGRNIDQKLLFSTKGSLHYLFEIPEVEKGIYLIKASTTGGIRSGKLIVK
jgi:photosystem II stability/assembly factor-like uncharacterized protein